MSTPPPRSRREVLAAFGAIPVLGIAGCTERRARYKLWSRPIGSSFTSEFTWEPDGPFAAFDRELAETVIERREHVTTGYRLRETSPERPVYVERDGTRYRISVAEGETVTRETWLLWFDRIDGKPPADAEVYSSSLGLGEQTPLDTTYGLSERDVEAVGDAEGRVATEFEFRDLEGEPPKGRGHLFLRRSPDETDLVPSPPFTHVAFETGDGTVYARATVEEVPVELTQYVHRATPVANTADAFTRYLRREYLAAAFRSDGLDTEHREVLDAATTHHGHETTVPLSEAFSDVLARLGLTDVSEPEPKRVEISDEVYFEYDGSYYEGQLEIFG